MMKLIATGSRDGKPVRIVVLGFSYMNLDKLREGYPIKFDGSVLGLGDTEIMIFAGETEQSMQQDVAEFIGPDTQVSISPGPMEV